MSYFRNHPTAQLRVAHVTNSLDMGGLEKLLVEFARHADRGRFDLHFVSLTTRGCIADEIAAHGWPITALEEPEGLRPGMVLRLAKWFRRWGIDIVHTHDNKPLIYGALAARLARVPGVIHSQHGRSFGIRPRQAFLVNRAADLTNRFVCVSEDSAVFSLQHGVAARKIQTICNGIDTTLFDYAGPRVDGPIVTIARLSPEKDVETLIRATQLAVREQPGMQVEIAGDGTCMLPLKQLTQELGLDDNVCFLGQVSDVPRLLERASLFVLSSISEGISLTLLEAMARGLPVVATRVGGNPEVVVDGVTGILVPPRNPQALAKAMLRLNADAGASRAWAWLAAIGSRSTLTCATPSRATRPFTSDVRCQRSDVRDQRSDKSL